MRGPNPQGRRSDRPAQVVGTRTPAHETDKEKKAKRVQVELRPRPSAEEPTAPLPLMPPIIQQTIEVDRKDMPELGATVPVTYEVAQ